MTWGWDFWPSILLHREGSGFLGIWISIYLSIYLYLTWDAKTMKIKLWVTTPKIKVVGSHGIYDICIYYIYRIFSAIPFHLYFLLGLNIWSFLEPPTGSPSSEGRTPSWHMKGWWIYSRKHLQNMPSKPPTYILGIQLCIYLYIYKYIYIYICLKSIYVYIKAMIWYTNAEFYWCCIW